MPQDDSRLIYKLGRKIHFLLVWINNTFGRITSLVFMLLYPIVILFTITISYLIFTIGGCSVKTIHYLIIGEFTFSMYTIPTQLTDIYPPVLCSMSPIATGIIFMILIGIFISLVYGAYQLHTYFKNKYIGSTPDYN